MRTRITEQEVADYRRDGFLLMPDFLSREELEEWRTVTERGVQTRLERGDELSNEATRRLLQEGLQAGQRPDPRRARMAQLLLDPQLGDIAAQLTGVERMRLWNDQALFKPPWGNPTAWHLDAPYWSFDDRRALTIWVALDDATLENGCLWYLPGTHERARFDAFELGSNLGGIFDAYPEWREVESVPAVLPAGGAVWHNGLIAHGAGREHDRPRAPRDDLRVHARRRHLQRQARRLRVHRGAGGGDEGRRAAGRRPAQPARGQRGAGRVVSHAPVRAGRSRHAARLRSTVVSASPV